MTFAINRFASLALPAVALLAAGPTLARAQEVPANRTQATRMPSSQPATPTPAPVAQPAPATQPAVSPLTQIPGVAIQYYDVTGATIEAIKASMASQRPVNATTGEPTPASAKWSFGTRLNKSTTDNVCKIVGATATFKGEVVLPRLVNAEGVVVPPPVLAEWQRFVGSLEQQQATYLRQVYDRRGELEKAVMASSCEGAGAAASKVINDINSSIAPAPPPAPAATPQG